MPMFNTKNNFLKLIIDYRFISVVFFWSLILRFGCIITNSLLVEEAYYWNYAEHLDFGYLDHPPMVALLIKLSTMIFGLNEWAVRFSCWFGWCGCTFFSYRLTTLINPNAGKYALLLLVSLPFFFLQSVVITPDLPLLVCWSAALYYLYRALVLHQPNTWYIAGVWLGLGMVSKYTIALLGLSIFCYLIVIPSARFWFKRREPYLAAVLALIIFSPVIYWNATHHWISFIFQSSRRFSAHSYPHIIQYIGLLLLFITPVGMISLWQLIRTSLLTHRQHHNNDTTLMFIKLFSFVPLVIFALFSLSHNIKFNWLGPVVLSLIPWFATQIAINSSMQLRWLITAVILMLSYSIALITISFNSSVWLQQILFTKFINWQQLTQQFYALAVDTELKYHREPVFVTLDLYPIASELSFYQAKLFAQGSIPKPYKIVGGHLFGIDSLMYRYWHGMPDLTNNILILVTKQPYFFNNQSIQQLTTELTPQQEIWSKSQGRSIGFSPFYYKIVSVKNH